jgi:MFS family permease
MPLYVHSGLGFGAFAVGWVSGSRFAASFIGRFVGGAYSDRHGPKRAVLVGLMLAPVAGLLYLGSLGVATHSGASITILLTGRFILGAAESFVVMVASGSRLRRHDLGSRRLAPDLRVSPEDAGAGRVAIRFPR